jgi:hypothetical protein
MEGTVIVSEKVFIDRDELLTMFREGINMYNNKANLSQISSNIYACKEYRFEHCVAGISDNEETTE